MPVAAPAVWIGGLPMSVYGWYGINQLTSNRNGPDSAELAVAWPASRRPAGVTRGTKIDISVAGAPYWAGSIDDIDWDEGTISCTGVWHEGDQAAAVDLSATGMLTGNPRTAVVQNITRGRLSWTTPTALPDADYVATDPDASPIQWVNALITATGTQQGLVYGVDGARRLFSQPIAPTGAPDWYILPQAGVLGITQEQLAGTLFGRYIVDETGTIATAMYVNPANGGDGPDVLVDLTPIGSMGNSPAAHAQQILAGIAAQAAGTNGWTKAATITRSQIMDAGGAHPHLSRVNPGQLARMLGQRDYLGRPVAVDVVLGETVWEPAGADGGQITASPVNLVPRDLESIIAATGAEAS